MDVQFGSLGDLNDDVVGHASDTTGINVFQPEQISFSGNLVEAFSKRKDGEFALISNDIRLLGISENREKENAAKQIRQAAVTAAKIRMMEGAFPGEVIQILQKTFNENELKSNPECKGILENIGYVGPIYVDRSAFKKCQEMKDFLHTSRSTSSAKFLLTIPECKDCTLHIGGLCQKTGLKLANAIDRSDGFLAQQIKRLKGNGKIANNKEISGYRDFLSALFLKDFTETRQSDHPIPQAKTGADYRAAIRALNIHSAEISQNRIKNAKEINNQRVIFPVLRFALEQIFHGKTGPFLKDAIHRKAFPDKVIMQCREELQAMVHDPSVIANLRFIPKYYDNCSDARAFIRGNNIKPQYISAMPKCDNCRYKERGICQLLKGTIIESTGEIPAASIVGKIDDLWTLHKISAEQAQECKTIEKEVPFSGLRNALNLIKQNTGRLQDFKREEPADFDSLLAHVDIENHVDVVTFVKDKLERGYPLAQIRQALCSAGIKGDVEQTIYEALFSCPTISAECLDDCTQTSYNFHPGALLIKSTKCENCHYADSLSCTRQKLCFASDFSASLNSMDEPESREIKNMFAAPEMVVEINSNTKKEPQLNLEFEKELGDIDAPTYQKESQQNYLNFFKQEPIKVDLQQPYQKQQEQEINGFGGGWDLSDALPW